MTRGLTLLILSIAATGTRSEAQAQDDAGRRLVGVWRVVSYPTSEGDLLRRHGREPGPAPASDAPLEGWSYLVFNANGECGLFMPQRGKRSPPHRRVTWFHDEDNFAKWKLDASVSPWRLDLESVPTPQFKNVRDKDPKTGVETIRRQPALDTTGKVVAKTWTYPAICRIDGDFLTIVWWQNHQLSAEPPEKTRPRDFAGLPKLALDGLAANNPLRRDEARTKLPGGVSCFIVQRVSDVPLPIPAPPPLEDALK